MKLIDVLEEIVNEGYMENASVHKYSGRAMFGRQCVAITVDDDNLVRSAMRLGSLITSGFVRRSSLEDFVGADEEACEICSEVRADNMGQGYVFYWPDVEYR
jgi:hypothetical protein